MYFMITKRKSELFYVATNCQWFPYVSQTFSKDNGKWFLHLRMFLIFFLICHSFHFGKNNHDLKNFMEQNFEKTLQINFKKYFHAFYFFSNLTICEIFFRLFNKQYA